MKKKPELNFDLKQMASFMELVRSGGFTSASRKLRVGQATISHHIRALEEMLGVKLFHRSGRESTLTPEGELFRKYCERVFREVDDLRDGLARGAFGGVTRVCASTVPAGYLIPEAAASIRKSHPDYAYRIEVAGSREVIEMIKEGRAEIGFVGRKISLPALVFQRVARDELVLAGAPSHPDAVTIQGLGELPFITRESGSGSRIAYEEALGRRGMRPSALVPVIECSSLEGVRESVIAGAGVAFMSRRVIERALDARVLKVIRVEGIKVERDFYAVRLKQRELSAPARALVEAIRGRERV
ncbi:MAG: LysR family transcriptional regulator [Spirochaetes bacterium]|nr:MAG: LysR family transcriptional regulator [Spirochaetota bacterium]